MLTALATGCGRPPAPAGPAATTAHASTPTARAVAPARRPGPATTPATATAPVTTPATVPAHAATSVGHVAPAPIAWRLAGNGGLGDRLLREWYRLRRSPAAIEHARSLGVADAVFDDLDGLLRLAGFGVSATPAADAVLAGLVRHAADDDLAARIVLQRILPGLLALAGAERRDGRYADALDDVVAEAWMAIRRYAPDRSGEAIAARLLNDTRHRAFTGPRRRRHLAVEPRDVQQVPERGGADDVQHPFVELTALLIGARTAGLSDDALATVRVLVAHDSVNAAAAAVGVTTRSLRYRRRALVEQLRALVCELGADEPRQAPMAIAV